MTLSSPTRRCLLFYESVVRARALMGLRVRLGRAVPKVLRCTRYTYSRILKAGRALHNRMGCCLVSRVSVWI